MTTVNMIYFGMGWLVGFVLTCAFLCIIVGGSCDR